MAGGGPSEDSHPDGCYVCGTVPTVTVGGLIGSNHHTPPGGINSVGRGVCCTIISHDHGVVPKESGGAGEKPVVAKGAGDPANCPGI